MKTSTKNILNAAGLVLVLVGFLTFVGCLVASSLVWTPGTPSATAQALTIIAACGIPASMLGLFLATLD